MTTRSGLSSVFAGAVLISFAPVFVKLVAVGPTTAGFYRMAFGGLVLAFVVALRRPTMVLDATALMFGTIAGVLFAADLIFWHQSIHDIGPGLSTIIANFQVFILAGFGVVVLRERAGWRLALAIPLAIAGLVLLVGGEWGTLPGDERRGVIFGLLTAVSYGSYLLVLRASQIRVARLDPMANLVIICAVASVILASWAMASGESLAIPDVRSGLLLGAYGVTAQVLGWVLISRGLSGTSASRAGLVLLSQPALAFVWDVLFFGRPTGLRDVTGASLALAAIYLGTRRIR
ncbi:MAG: DMT family transporter [Gemmatimonadales bacterium]